MWDKITKQIRVLLNDSTEVVFTDDEIMQAAEDSLRYLLRHIAFLIKSADLVKYPGCDFIAMPKMFYRFIHGNNLKNNSIIEIDINHSVYNNSNEMFPRHIARNGDDTLTLVPNPQCEPSVLATAVSEYGVVRNIGRTLEYNSVKEKNNKVVSENNYRPFFISQYGVSRNHVRNHMGVIRSIYCGKSFGKIRYAATNQEHEHLVNVPCLAVVYKATMLLFETRGDGKNDNILSVLDVMFKSELNKLYSTEKHFKSQNNKGRFF